MERSSTWRVVPAHFAAPPNVLPRQRRATTRQEDKQPLNRGTTCFRHDPGKTKQSRASVQRRPAKRVGVRARLKATAPPLPLSEVCTSGGAARARKLALPKSLRIARTSNPLSRAVHAGLRWRGFSEQQPRHTIPPRRNPCPPSPIEKPHASSACGTPPGT